MIKKSSNNKVKSSKIIEWLNSGGGQLLGDDTEGEPMYSVSNGCTLMLLSALIIPTVLVIASLIFTFTR